MELTTKGRYAVMALADLASRPEAALVPLSQLAERQTLPLAYLEQLFVALRRAGIVESTRGRAGGYRLARAPSDISINDVMTAVDEDTRFTRCTDDGHPCTGERPCLTHGLWTALGEMTLNFLSSVSLADVVSGKPIGTETVARPADLPERAYLDCNATAPLRPAARAAMIAALDIVGNPSSVHREGRRARDTVENAREQVARLVGAKPSEVVFTSGASEANAWVMSQPWDTVFATSVEHGSILAPARAGTAEFVEVGVDGGGTVILEQLERKLGAAGNGQRVLVAVQLANNETGIVQPVADVVRIARAHGAFVHSDAVQAAGRIAIDFSGLALDVLSLASHKLGGPKGIGALIIRDRLDLAPLIRGGGQERRRRAGTENVAAIAGFGAAAEAASAGLADVARISRLRDRLEAAIREATPDAVIIGAGADRIANTSCVALPGKLAETLVIRMDLAGICVSAGAACSSGKVGASHVLEAMGFARSVAGSAIRISLGPDTTDGEIARFIEAWNGIAAGKVLAA